MKKQWILGAVVVIFVVYLWVWCFKGYSIRQVSALAEMPITVIIDPGHGGIDGGASTADGVRESQINLEISLKVDALLVFCGFQTKLIRDSDISIHESDAQTISAQKISDLKQRVQMVNDTNKGVLLSIHQNTFPETKYHGAQVFFSQTDTSQNWAEITQNALTTLVDSANTRQAKASTQVYLMDNIQCPGILVECGFLSNPEEAQLLQQADYQRKLALAMVDGLSQWQQEGREHHEV